MDKNQVDKIEVFRGCFVHVTYQPTDMDRSGCDGLYVKKIEITKDCDRDLLLENVVYNSYLQGARLKDYEFPENDMDLNLPDNPQDLLDYPSPTSP